MRRASLTRRYDAVPFSVQESRAAQRADLDDPACCQSVTLRAQPQGAAERSYQLSAARRACQGGVVASAGPWWPTIDSRYAVARDAVVEAEHDVSRAVEALAVRRRALPAGSMVSDYEFIEGPRDIYSGDQPSVVKMVDLFGEHPSLMLYNFMFDGTTTEPCAMCTSLIDGYDGAAADLEQRVGFAVVAPAPLEALRAYGRGRGWRNVRLLSDQDGVYSRDSGGINSTGDLSSLMTVFSRREGNVRHFYTSQKPTSADGQDDRHLDLIWALWGALDLTPEGRGAWRPSRPSRR